ncbi:L-threonine 3-dehydrogenase [subsurface metagenome]
MTRFMKALVKTQKGRGFIKLQNIQIPSLGPSDILVKIKYAAICGTDLNIYEW